MVRKDDDQAARLRAVGAEVVLGDLLDLDSVRVAMEGVGAAYFVYPLLPGLIDATAYFAQAAREAGLALLWHFLRVRAFWDSRIAFCVIHGWSASWRADHGRELEIRS
jgi:NAD(P)H dehydrogenase (quinone)